ncbi:MAG: CinA family nicotinamide mononucleotide deamidase-related protein [Chitinophagaceae bacterium]|nr:CinA family nicotinamide mononucleotide deamidase-related protein [Chitinophagaceae bacterium]
MHKVNASIITIGDELLIGQTIDTNSAFIAQEFNKTGVWVHRRVAVGDVYDDIRKALDDESVLSDIIVITGGLGPTADDITKPLLCEYFGGKMIVNEKVKAHVIHLFEKIFRRPGPMLERNLKQAEVPDVCTVLHNARGTAPGMLFRKNGKLFFSLPGVPHEMKGLIVNEVIPVIQKEFALPAIIHRTVFTAGRGESMIAELLQDFEASLPSHIKLAYLPNYGMVKLRLTSIGDLADAVNKELEPFFIRLQELVKDFMVVNDDKKLEEVVGQILRKHAKTMGTAESCTGGYIAHLITSIAGSSDYYKGSVVSYDNTVKSGVLGVNQSTLSQYGAVSEQTVTEMANGLLKTIGTDFALATSGIMGPGGGTPEKPVGTVWIAVATAVKTETLQLNLRFDRERNIHMTAAAALDFLRKFILANT